MKKIALLMIFLIVTIPIYSSVSMAYVNIQVYGKDRVDNLLREVDNQTVIVKTDIKNVKKENVKYVEGSYTYPFGSCTSDALANLTTCSYFKQGVFPITRHDFSVNIFNDANRLVGSANSFFVVDKVTPQVSITNVDESNKNISISYLALDPAPCASLSKLELFVDNTKKQEISLIGNCSKDGTINIAKSSINDGVRNICLYVKDVAGFTSNPDCREFVIDTTPPTIGNIEITNEEGDITHYFSNIEANFVFSFNLTTNFAGFSKNEVYADLSELNPDSAQGFERLSCSKITSTIWTCSKAVLVKITQNKVASIKINATDDSGNLAVATKTYDLKYVSAAPVISKIYTNYRFANNSYFGRNNIVYAEISSSAPITQVTADIGGSSVVGSCKGTANVKCQFEYNLSGAPSTINVLVNGKDATATQFTKLERFPVDVSNPILKSAFFVADKQYLENGDNVKFVLNLTDSISEIDPYETYASFGFMGADYLQKGSCTNYNKYAECEFLLNDIKAGDIKINGTFKDVVGNENFFTINSANLYYFNGSKNILVPNIKAVYQRSNVSRNLWAVEARSVTPSQLDRQVTQIGLDGAGLSIYAVLAYSPLTSNVKMFSSQVVGCSSPYVDSVSMIDAGNTKILAIQLYLQPLKNINSLDMECNVSTISIVNGREISMPEIDRAKISIPIYSNPIGEMDANVLMEIDAVTKKVNNWYFSLAAKIQKLIDMSQTLCDIINMYKKVVGMMATVADALLEFPATVPAGESLAKVKMAVDIKGKVFFKIADKYCMFIECKLGFSELFKKLSDTDAAGVPKEPAKYDQGYAFADGAFKTLPLDFWNKVCGQTYSETVDTSDVKITQGELDDMRGNTVENIKQAISPSAEAAGFDPAESAARKSEYEKSNTALTEFKNSMGSEQDGATRFMYNWFANAGPKTSIFMSIACLCLPGIAYNLNKYRQIECTYLKCLKNTQFGTPKQVCDQMRDYLKCKYFYGEVFQAIPFAPLINAIMMKMKTALTNIGSLFGVALHFFCNSVVTAPGQNTVCYVADWIERVKGLFCNLGIPKSSGCKPFWTMEDKKGQDICEEVLGESDKKTDTAK